MKTEFLKTLGLEKEAIDKIMAENGADIERELDWLLISREQFFYAKNAHLLTTI